MAKLRPVSDPVPVPWEKKSDNDGKVQLELRSVPQNITNQRGWGKSPDPNSQTSKKIVRFTEEFMLAHPLMKAKRDKFIAEFLIDFNGPLAWIRSGGSYSTAAKMGNQYLREPYVAKKIWEVIDSLEEAKIINRKRILAGLVREANFMGIGASHSARVSAYSKLASILGMDAPQKVEAKVKFTGGVMLVPFSPDAKEWEKNAIEAQKKLKEEAEQ
ncbi:MAG TPA: terminase small subunit [Candidatus Methanoperedens sp.]